MAQPPLRLETWKDRRIKPSVRQFIGRNFHTIAWGSLFLLGIVCVFILFRDELFSAVGYIRGCVISLYVFVLIAMCISLLVMVTMYLRLVRQKRGVAILTYVEQAVRLNLPLEAFIGAALNSERGAISLRLWRLRSNLLGGWHLADALGSAAPDIPHRIIKMLDAGERMGQLKVVLSRIVKREQQRRDPLLDRYAFLRFYPLFMMFTLLFMVLWFVNIVIPKYREIFADFRIELPVITKYVIGLSDSVYEWWWLLIWIGLGLVFCWMMGQIMSEILMPYWGRFRTRNKLMDYILWLFPPTRILARQRGLADIFQVMAEGMAAGHALPLVLEEAQQLELNTVLRKHLRKVAQQVQNGTTLSVAFRQVPLPALVAGLLASGEISGNVGDTCVFLAQYYRSRFNQFLIFLQACLEPFVVIMLGLIVGTIAFAMFTPLTKLIDHMVGYSIHGVL